jgi:hypothetical protein
VKLHKRYLPFIAMLGICAAAPSALAAPAEASSKSTKIAK